MHTHTHAHTRAGTHADAHSYAGTHTHAGTLAHARTHTNNKYIHKNTYVWPVLHICLDTQVHINISFIYFAGACCVLTCAADGPSVGVGLSL